MPDALTVAIVAKVTTTADAIAQQMVRAAHSTNATIEVTTQKALSATALRAPPDILMLVGDDALQWLPLPESSPKAKQPLVVFLCESEEAEKRGLELGANDVQALLGAASLRAVPFVSCIQRAMERRLSREVADFQEVLLKARSRMADSGDGPDVLRAVLLMAGRALHFDRVCMMAHVESSASACILAATDDPTLSQFELAIHDYPEVREAIRTGSPLLIDDVLDHPITQEIGPVLKRRGVRGIAVFPVSWKGRSMGALLFRKRRPGVQHVNKNAQTFGILLAAQLAAQLRDSRIFEDLRDRTRRLSRAAYEAARRARTIESLKEYFEASAEGVFVLDKDAKVIFVNKTGESLLGFASGALVGVQLPTLLPEAHRDSVAPIIAKVLQGHNIDAIDLPLCTTAGNFITVSLTTSTVLSKNGAAILSFRNVSEQRSLEAQLQQSRDLLSKLIDSAVDAIVAARPDGQIIVFNQGAEHLFEYRAAEVIDAQNMSYLYPDGVHSHVMHLLRGDSHGGVGRLEQIRREVLTRSGERVPVNMTASVVYDDGEEIAIVAIFSDLRDRIRIEQRLLQVQDQLKNQEQQNMLAELAGAAAHELNQPLTSIIGYAQLIQRTGELEPRHTRYTETIVAEAERMADIVKKIGHITHYESVKYVGSANIVDLNKSMEASKSAPVPAILYSKDDDATAKIALRQLQESTGDLEQTKPIRLSRSEDAPTEVTPDDETIDSGT